MPDPVEIGTCHEINVAEKITVVVGSAQLQLDGSLSHTRTVKETPEPAAHATPATRSDWFQTLTHFIPKSIREPWLGDIRETRIIMASEGYSRRIIARATVTQFLLLIFHWVFNTVRDMLMLLKKPGAD